MVLQIRACELRDLTAVAAIYALEVEAGTASFETEAPDLAEMGRRHEAIRARSLPYLVAERDGLIAGYAYAGAYRARPAYRLTVENSVYVARDARRQGIGQALLRALIEAACLAGMRQMVAIIGDSANQGSVRLHAGLGFEMVGTLREVGFKFDRFLDTVIMQRRLGGHAAIG